MPRAAPVTRATLRMPDVLEASIMSYPDFLCGFRLPVCLGDVVTCDKTREVLKSSHALVGGARSRSSSSRQTARRNIDVADAALPSAVVLLLEGPDRALRKRHTVHAEHRQSG